MVDDSNAAESSGESEAMNTDEANDDSEDSDASDASET